MNQAARKADFCNREQLRQLKKDQHKDAKALFALQHALDGIINPRIMEATTSKEAWDTLKEEFQGSAKVRAVKLQTLCHIQDCSAIARYCPLWPSLSVDRCGMLQSTPP
ncbi:hypothetical protein ACE6H2_022921 [Prunus campanulata]